MSGIQIPAVYHLNSLTKFTTSIVLNKKLLSDCYSTFFPSPLAPPSGSLENHADTHPASSSTTTLRATVLRSPLLCQPSFDFDSKHYTQSPPPPVPISKAMIEPKRVPPPPAPQDLIAKGTVVPAVMLTRSDSDIPVHPQSQVLYISGKPPPPMRST